MSMSLVLLILPLLSHPATTARVLVLPLPLQNSLRGGDYEYPSLAARSVEHSRTSGSAAWIQETSVSWIEGVDAFYVLNQETVLNQEHQLNEEVADPEVAHLVVASAAAAKQNHTVQHKKAETTPTQLMSAGTLHWLSVALLASLLLVAMAPILLRDGLLAFATALTYVVCLMLVQLLVKDVLSSGYTYPYSITAMHVFSTACVASAFDRPKLKDAFRVLPISLVCGAALALSNTALVFGTASFVAMIGSCTPASTFAIEAITKRNASPSGTFAILCVCLGGILCIHGEHTSTNVALLLAAMANCCRSFKTVWQYGLLQAELSPLCIVAWSGIWSFAWMVPIAGFYEGFGFLSNFGSIPFHVKSSVILSTAAATVLNIVQCVALRHLGPVQQAVIGSLQLIMVLLLASAWLYETVGMCQWLGVLMIVIGCFVTKTFATRPKQEA